MAKKWLGTWVGYHSGYGGETLRGGVHDALERLRRALERCATHGEPVKVSLALYEAQCEALWELTHRSKDHDPEQARLSSGQQENPLLAAAEARLGPGELDRYATGSSGDLWRTRWTAVAEQPEQVARILAFACAHADQPRIHASWSHRGEREVSEQVVLTAEFEPVWTAPDEETPLPGQPFPEGRGSRIMAFLGRTSGAVFDLLLPFHAIDEAFATWEQAFCDALGVCLGESRYVLVSLPAGRHEMEKIEQGRYRRFDWTEEGRRQAPRPGPWDDDVQALIAPRVGVSAEYDLRDSLQRSPRSQVVAALLHGVAPLKGAPLERGCSMLQQLVEDREAADSRAELAPAMAAFLANPPVSKVCRKVACAFGEAGGDPWLLDLLRPFFLEKKVPVPVLDFAEELVVFDDGAKNPLLRAQLQVTALRHLRPKGAWSRRATYRNCLGGCDDGSAWATWVLEAATPHPNFETWNDNSWTREVYERWQSRGAVRDPRFDAFRDRVPTGELPEGVLSLDINDEERVLLLSLEAAWLGARA